MEGNLWRMYCLWIFWLQLSKCACSRWSNWWTYEGISGPTFWGQMNGDWFMCSKGKNQSPIDIHPALLLYDPALKHLVIHGDRVGGTLVNNGFDITLEINDTNEFGGSANFSLGPLSYQYTLRQIKIHFGGFDGSGSEHTVNGHSFDGEIQFIAYNSDVYANLSHAKSSPRGVAILAAFLQTRNKTNEEFELFSNLSQLIIYSGQRVRLKSLSLRKLLPNIEHYMTYEGSLTQPGCQETATWIILNKPLSLGTEQMEALRNLRQRDIDHPQAFMFGNNRPIMPLNRRVIRTNINFERGCTMERDMRYQLNSEMTLN